jgi:predicted transcriptional regulator of viral defense system
MRRDATMTEQALELAKRLGVVRLRDAMEHGIHPEVLRRLVASEQMVRVARGVYSLPDRNATEHDDLVQAAIRVPAGVICLLSALNYHQIGTQMPHEVWMMIDRRSRRPTIDSPPMRFILASGSSLKDGVDTVTIQGHEVKVFNPAKTVVDCFRYRRHVGLEVAIEALRETTRDRRCTPDAIARYAASCGVWSVVRPYLEAVA